MDAAHCRDPTETGRDNGRAKMGMQNKQGENFS
jgi:hypothetical protein